jgi:DNA-binding CsgD family transcriptional regulator/tetratricopeptide (TPR) repeat protein
MAVPVFVGRTPELGFLRSRLAEARAGRPQTVLVEGPAGIGKSALLARFTHTLVDAPALTASGDEAEKFLSFGILLQLLDCRVASWEHPFAAGADLLQFLDERNGPHPTVFVIDDAHLADSDSLTALTFALRRLRADRVMAVFAVREEEDLSSLPPGLLRLVEAQAGRLKLAGLPEVDVVELGAARGAGRMNRRAAARLRQHTGGNPLYLGALIDELPVGGFDVDGPLPAPHSYARVVIRALAAQSEDARRLARAAAVVADDCLVDLVAGVAGVAAPEPALKELVGSSLVTTRYAGDGWCLRFAHPLVKAVVYDDIGPEERRQLHSRAAQRLRGEEALVHRVAASRGTDAALAEELATCAKADRERGQLHRAAELYANAAALSGEGQPSNTHLMDAIELFLRAGDVTAAVALAGRIGDVPPSGRRFHLQAKIAQLAGQSREAEEFAAQAWRRSGEVDPNGRGPLAAILAQLCNMRGDGEAAAQWADRALAHDLPSDLADSTAATRAIGLTLAGKLTDALTVLERDVPADSTATPRWQHQQLCARGALRAAVDDLASARLDLAALSVASGGELAPNRLVAMGALAEVEYRLGDWDSSLAVATQALSLAEDTGQVWVQGYLHAAAVAVTAARGDWNRAEGHLHHARELASALSDPVTFALCENAAVHIAFCQADPEQVVAACGVLLGMERGPTHEPGLLSWPVPYLAALVELNRLDEAAEQIASFEAVARARGSRSRLAGLARVRGELATARRDHTAARAAFAESFAVGAGVTAALDVALTHAAYGRFLRRRGEKRAAVDELHAARARCLALGATPFLQGCDVELAACGEDRLPYHPTGSTLTPQERVIARLVCQGLTNQQVARQLVLSAKTVGYHLNNVYAKLEVHSRTQLLAVLGPPA